MIIRYVFFIDTAVPDDDGRSITQSDSGGFQPAVNGPMCSLEAHGSVFFKFPQVLTANNRSETRGPTDGRERRSASGNLPLFSRLV